MTTYNIPSRIPEGDSEPVDPCEHSLIKLPGELQNKIFRYLVEFSNPVTIIHPNTSSYFISPLKIARGIPTNLFLACRTTYFNAGSAFYSNNTFWISPHITGFRFSDNELAQAIVEFLQNLGSQARWIRKVSIDFSRMSWLPRYEIRDWGQTDRVYHGFNAGPLLDFIWHHRLTIDTTWVLEEAATDSGHCNAPAMTLIMRSLLGGQLKIKAYRNLACAVIINYDGSGGDIILNRVTRYWDQRFPRFEPDKDQNHSFITEDGGRRLALVQPTPRTLLSLPENILRNIVSEEIRDLKEVCLDLDVDTKLPLGFPHVNRHMYEEHWHTWLSFKSYTLLLSSTHKRSTFSDFGKLARLLRREFTLPSDVRFHLRSRETWMLENSKQLRVVLNFNLAEPTSLEDLRISVLPLLLETSSTNGDRKVIIRSLAPGPDRQIIVGERTITLHELRLNAIMALMGCVFKYDDPLEILIWINGLGTVVEQEINPNGPRMYGREKDIDTASTISYDGPGSWYRIASMHPKDRRYRGSMDRSNCLFNNCKQFFPFQHSSSQILRYPMWVLDKYNAAPDICREGVFDNSRLKCVCNRDECDFWNDGTDWSED